jgi:hypothetical protein
MQLYVGGSNDNDVARPESPNNDRRRRIAAIFAVNVVGYSPLIAGTGRRLQG